MITPLDRDIAAPLKPADHAETLLLEAILSGRLDQGGDLPPERLLSQQLGVTRPTLREALQRISRDGWISISHGKPTRVNHFLEHGGLGILKTLAGHPDLIPAGMILSLLEFRCFLLPGVAEAAAARDRDSLSGFLVNPPETSHSPDAFARYDWNLQSLMIRLCKNPVARLIYNDFNPLYQLVAPAYFDSDVARQASFRYYENLKQTLFSAADPVKPVVESAMNEALDLYRNRQNGI